MYQICTEKHVTSNRFATVPNSLICGKKATILKLSCNYTSQLGAG